LRNISKKCPILFYTFLSFVIRERLFAFPSLISVEGTICSLCDLTFVSLTIPLISFLHFSCCCLMGGSYHGRLPALGTSPLLCHTPHHCTCMHLCSACLLPATACLCTPAPHLSLLLCCLTPAPLPLCTCLHVLPQSFRLPAYLLAHLPLQV